jgi:malonyl CoA-acyl carrier protein transacylase
MKTPRYRPCELFLISAPDRAALMATISELEKKVGVEPFAELAASCASTWQVTMPTLALVADDPTDLAKKLSFAREKLGEADRTRIQSKGGVFYYEDRIGPKGRTAFIFPGEGAQYLNMLSDLAVYFPEVRAAFDLVDHACLETGEGYRPSARVFPVSGTPDEQHKALFEMETAVEAVSAANLGLASLFARLEIKADAVVGHSSGEFIALDTAGIVRFKDEAHRGAFIRDGFLGVKKLVSRTDIPRGILITVGGVGRDKVDAVMKPHGDDVLVAMDNCPHQVVLCAKPELVEPVMKALSASGAIVGQLEFDRPYHTPWFTPALDGLRELFDTYGVFPPRIETWSCLTAQPFSADLEEIKQTAVGQWAGAVRFSETIQNMYDAGVRTFIEIGPRGNLTAFVNDILKDREVLAIAANRMQKSGWQHLVFNLAMLAAHGVPFNPRVLFEGRVRTEPEPPKRGKDYSFYSYTPRLQAKGIAITWPKASPAVGGESAVSESDHSNWQVHPDEAEPLRPVLMAYLDTMEQFLHMQEEVIGSVLDRSAGLTRVERGEGTPAPNLSAEWSRGAPTAIHAHPPATPMIHEYLKYEAGQTMEALAHYSLKEHVFLLDHALGQGEVSVVDPKLGGFAVMPLTMSLNTLSEAARSLFPGKVVIGLRDIRANKWVSFENNTRTVRLVATVKSSEAVIEVHAAMREEDPSDPRAAFRPPMNEAIIQLADQYPPAPKAPSFALQHPKPCHWTGSEIYPDRLFHGKMFQGITSINGWGENGVTGTVEVLDRTRLLASNPKPNFAIDGILLDTVGGTLGLWGAYDKYDGFVYLPFRIGGVQFYQGLLPEGTAFDLHLNVVRRTDVSAAADIYAFDKQGRVAVGIQGWEDRDFNVTPALHRVTHEPLAYTFCEMEPDDGLGVLRCISPELPADYFESGHRVWEHVLRLIVLSRAERRMWETERLPERRHWLLSRTAAKDAVRMFLERHYSIHVGSADVELEQTGPDQFVPLGFWLSQIPVTPRVSVEWRKTRAVASHW